MIMLCKDKENMFIMNEKVGNIRSEIKNNQMEILELKICSTEYIIHYMGLIANFSL